MDVSLLFPYSSRFLENRGYFSRYFSKKMCKGCSILYVMVGAGYKVEFRTGPGDRVVLVKILENIYGGEGGTGRF